MAKSVKLVSFITYLMITMLISSVNSKPQLSPDPDKERKGCRRVMSETAPSAICKKQMGDHLSCNKHCQRERFMCGKCGGLTDGKSCWCFLARCGTLSC
uniref:SCR-like protein n=1 Tax=Leavenworthia alabamica TaxID=310722 RepID=A0A2Z4HJE7_LEAAL|nr:SCR-like protein [Leavenworthia alabamica]